MAIRLPTELTVIRWPGHQKDKSSQTQGNNHADQIAKEAALGEPKPQAVLELSAVRKPPLWLHKDAPEHDPAEIKSCSDLGTQENHNVW